MRLVARNRAVWSVGVLLAISMVVVAFLPSRDSDSVLPGVSVSAAPKPPFAEPLIAGRTPVEDAVLHLEVRDENGDPIEGEVLWTTSSEPPLGGSRLAPEWNALPADASRASYRASAELSIPPGHWTWLRVTDARRRLDAFCRVEPFSGQRTRRVTIDSRDRALHVFVLRSDLGGSAPGVEVQLFSRDLKTTGPPALVSTREADSHGYVLFEKLEPGAFLACAPGSQPTDPSPHTGRAVMPPGMPARELPLTVVVCEPLQTVRLNINAALKPGVHLHPLKLYLKRVGGGLGLMKPAVGTVRDGKHKLAVRVPAGDYELGILPIGDLEMEPNRPVVTVTEGADAELDINLWSATRTAAVILEGLRQNDLPVSVYPRRPGQLNDEDSRILFWGPYRWRRLKAQVAPLGFEAHLVALGKIRNWISDRAYALGPARIVVRMVPATNLWVRWYGGGLDRGDPAVVEVTSSQGTETVALTPQLIQEVGAMRPGLAGMLMVPRGMAKLTCWGVGGQVVWRREVQADKPVVVVRVE